MVIVVGSLILTCESSVASIAYAWGFAREMTKLVSCVEVSLRRCEMMYAPSGVGSRVRGGVRFSGMVMSSEEREEVAITMPCVSASRRYPCAMLWVCADMDGNCGDVEDCINIDERHHGA